MKKVVVTGGAGFIGSHLVGELSQSEHEVKILDDMSTGREENIESLLKRDNIELIKGSVTDLPLLEKIFHGVSQVFHLAAFPSVTRSVNDPENSHRVNATGTLNVLLAARRNHVSKVIYASSSSVYGDTPTLPKKEDMPPNPLSPYAVSKLTGEYYCQVFEKVYQLPTIILRYFNVYGPRQDPDSQYAAVIPRFIQSTLNGNPLVIYGDGEQTRDFTFVRDVVEANILAANSDICGLFNISRGERITINRLVEVIMGLTGGKSEVIYQEPRPGDVRHSQADITMAGTFGYKPRYSLKEGLAEMIRWFHGS